MNDQPAAIGVIGGGGPFPNQNFSSPPENFFERPFRYPSSAFFFWTHPWRPAFSTRAESDFHRRMGFDVIGMTNSPEAKLSREAEISFASLCFITDYDCWKVDDEPVTAEIVIGHLLANAAAARRILPNIIARIPTEPTWPEHPALASPLVTDRKLWPELTVKKLEVILKRFL